MTEEATAIPGDSPLKTFVLTFNYSLITVSVQPQAEGALVPAGKRFSTLNRVRAFTLSQFLSSEVQGELQIAQMNGCAVYFMVNEGDGKPAPDAPPGILNCGKRVNVQTLKALFIDTDEADSKALLIKLKELRFLPHLIVETRPGRYHFYFLLNDLPAEGEHINQWIAMQKFLASLVPSLDQSMADINQVLRLPTFFNHKHHPPFRVHIFKSSDHSRYTLEPEFHRLGAFTHLTPVHLNGSSTYTKFEFPSEPLSKGSRRQGITRFIEHLMENILPLTAKPEEYFMHVDVFIERYLREEDRAPFLPGGDRRSNLEQYFEDQRNFRLAKRHREESLRAIELFDHVHAMERDALPDDFYLNFPGDLGFITREIRKLSPVLSLELCFAGALIISGAMKAESFKYHGFWPMVNGICIAPTGAGKTTLKAIVKAFLQEAGLLGQYPQLLDFPNTVQSLHTDLYSAGGVGTALIDESGDYLGMITAKNAPGYVKALKKYYKEATTGPEQGNRLTPGTSLSFQVPPIDGGFLSLWMFIQPEKFSGSLSLEDMRDGFLPRFLVFKGKSSYLFGASLQATKDCRQSFNAGLDMKVWLESHAALMPHVRDDQVEHVVAAARAATQAARGNAQAVALAQRTAVYRLRSESRRMGPAVEVIATEDAKAAIGAYLDELREAAERTAKEDEHDPRLDIYVRSEEMLGRLLCSAATIVPGSSQAVIDLPIAEHVIRLYRFQTARFFGGELKDMTQDQEMERVIDAVMRAVRKAEGASVTISQVMYAFKGSHRPKSKDLSAILQEAVKQGRIWSESRPHSRAKNKTVPVYRPADSEDGPIH